MSDEFDEDDWPITYFKHDRRRTRLTLPDCPECGQADPHVDVRTADTLHVRCKQCGHRMDVPKITRASFLL